MATEKKAQVVDFSAIEKPLNAAIKIIAQNKGIPWTRTVEITLSVSKNEYHIGPDKCRLNPKTVVQGDLMSVIERLFEMAETLDAVKRNKRAEAIAYEREAVIKKMQYLRRALHNGEFETFIHEELLTILPPPPPIEIPYTGRAIQLYSECPHVYQYHNSEE